MEKYYEERKKVFDCSYTNTNPSAINPLPYDKSVELPNLKRLQPFTYCSTDWTGVDGIKNTAEK